MAYQRRIRDLVLDSDLDSLKEELELNEDLVTIEIGRGNTLLHFACYENVDDSIAKWLIANGADMEVVNYDDDKPIDVACAKGGNRDAMLVLMHNGFKVRDTDTEDDIDSDISSYPPIPPYTPLYKWRNDGSNSRDVSPSTSHDSCMSLDSGPSRRNSMGHCNGLTSRQRRGSEDSLETIDAFYDEEDDKPVRRVPQSLCKQRDNCDTVRQHNRLNTNARGKRTVAVLPRGQEAVRRVPQSLCKQRDNCDTVTQHNHLNTNARGKRAVSVLPRRQEA